MERFFGQTRDELVSQIVQLMMECDDHVARIDALESQIRSLGAHPVSHTSLDPGWNGDLVEGREIGLSIAASGQATIDSF